MKTAADGLTLIKLLEPQVAPLGLHLALGGSLAYRGTSEKDIDIMVYTHSKEPLSCEQFFKLLNPVLESAGFVSDHNEDYPFNYSILITESPLFGRVDFFFLIRPFAVVV